MTVLNKYEANQKFQVLLLIPWLLWCMVSIPGFLEYEEFEWWMMVAYTHSEVFEISAQILEYLEFGGVLVSLQSAVRNA